MTTPSAPSSISMSQINTEVGYSSTATLSFSNTRFKALANDFVNPISISSARGKTFTTKQVFSATGADTFVVPTSITSITVKLWGSGGGGGGTGAGNGYTGGGGGSAGFVHATISVTAGETLNVFVPYGGLGTNLAMYGAGGGSWAGIFRGSTPLVIAGGGGGGGAGRNTTGGDGGYGGGSTAGASNYRGGGGGTQSAGGSGGVGDTGTAQAGSLYAGGDGWATGELTSPGDNGAGAILGNANYGVGGTRGDYSSDHAMAGGGGAGYYGGGGGGNGGNQNNSGGGGGGGGSSYWGGPGVTRVTDSVGLIGNNGNNVLPGGSGDADYASGVGVGSGADIVARGGSGRVVISWSYP